MGSAGGARGWRGVRAWCVAWWHSGRDDADDTEFEEEPSDATPVSVETPLQSSVSRCTSLNVIRDPYATRTTLSASGGADGGTSPARRPPTSPGARDSRSLPADARISSDGVYTILIRLPPDPDCRERAPSIKMIQDDVPLPRINRPLPLRGDSEFNLNAAGHNHLTRRTSQLPDVRIPLNAKIIPKQLAGKTTLLAAHTKQQEKKKKKTQEKKQETKAAKTLSAILLSFILTWTPYNILVLIKPLTACTGCIPTELWSFFYALCYINSTINPMCYALCNASFRRTYVRILTCKWQNRNREAMTRGVYN